MTCLPTFLFKITLTIEDIFKCGKSIAYIGPMHEGSQTIYIPQANGAKRRSGRKPGARVTNSALAFTYIWIMRCYIAQWHSGIKSRPPFWIWTLVGHLTLCACVSPDREKAGN